MSYISTHAYCDAIRREGKRIQLHERRRSRQQRVIRLADIQCDTSSIPTNTPHLPLLDPHSLSTSQPLPPLLLTYTATHPHSPRVL